MCKMKFTLNGIVGNPYGSSFIVRDGHLVKASSCDIDNCSADQGNDILMSVCLTKPLVNCDLRLPKYDFS